MVNCSPNWLFLWPIGLLLTVFFWKLTKFSIQFVINSEKKEHFWFHSPPLNPPSTLVKHLPPYTPLHLHLEEFRVYPSPGCDANKRSSATQADLTVYSVFISTIAFVWDGALLHSVLSCVRGVLGSLSFSGFFRAFYVLVHFAASFSSSFQLSSSFYQGLFLHFSNFLHFFIQVFFYVHWPFCCVTFHPPLSLTPISLHHTHVSQGCNLT